jgi:hypothetical protein
MSTRAGIGAAAGLVAPTGVTLAGAPWWVATTFAFGMLLVALIGLTVPQESQHRLEMWQPIIAWLVSAPRRRRRRTARRAKSTKGNRNG